jgi:uncharacterized membrane protein
VGPSGGLPAVNTIDMKAPFRWLRGGWSDLCGAPVPCLTYGLMMAVVSFLLSYTLIITDAAFWVLVLTIGFVFIAPMLAMGLYAAGQLLEHGKTPTLRQMLFVRAAIRQDVTYLGFALVLIYLLWGRVAQIVYGLSTYQLHRTVEDFTAYAIGTPDGHAMLFAGSLIGGGFAFFTYCLVVVSAPMLLHRDANVFAATATSVKAVTQNIGPMALWALIIAILTLSTAATGFLGLILVFPWLGLASWRAYRDLVPEDSSP